MTIFLLAAALFDQILKLAMPLLLGGMIDILSLNDTAAIRRESGNLTLLFALATSTMFGINFFARRGIVRLVHVTKGNLICSAFEHLLRLPVGFHETNNTGSKSKTIQNGAEKTLALAESWTRQGLPNIISYILSATVLLIVWWPAGIIIGIGVPLIILLSVLFYRLGRHYREERHECYNASENILLESMQHVATVQSFRVEESLSQKLRNIWKRVFEIGFAEQRTADYGYLIRNAAIVFSIAAMMYFGFNAVAEGVLTGGMFILVLIIATRMTENLWPIGQIIDETMYNAPSLRRLRELFAIESDVQEKENALSMKECTGSIVFDGVTFKYPGKEADALNNFSLDIKPNKTVALIGPSGAGKSTILRLAGRVADPSSGRILLDGVDLREYSFDFRKHIAIVSQKIDIFSGTVAENIAFGNKNLSRADIERYAAMAHVDEFVQKLPKKYDTVVGERGVLLSGGQCQRLAIARALAANCRIILFDEATSHLDRESEVLIQQALRAMEGSHTIVIIAHRLATIRHADEIVVIENGRVVERGNHEILEKVENGVYRRYLDADKK
ncbi:MAG: ABC transporter ATP-binding protein [Patescibacteria group bacterium]